jgi:hypothetical protein
MQFRQYIVIIFLVLSCNKEVNNIIGLKVDVAEHSKNSRVLNNDISLSYRIVNNPYQWSNDALLLIYLDGEVCFKGDYSQSGILHCKKFTDNQPIHCTIEILSGGRLYIFEDKSVFNWDSTYKFLYIGFFPDNPSTDNIHFFPQS